MTPSPLRSNKTIGLGLSASLLLLLAYLLLSDWVYLRLRDGFYLGAFPVAAVVGMLVCSVVLAFDGRRHLVPERMVDFRWIDLLKVLAIVAGAWAFFELARRSSTLLAGPIFLITLMYILGARPWSSTIVAGVVMAAIVYAVFRLLGIELPHGMIPY
jgi:hypothetical protein